MGHQIGTTRTAVVAAIQGNVPQLGLDFTAQRWAVLQWPHHETTENMQVAAGRWP